MDRVRDSGLIDTVASGLVSGCPYRQYGRDRERKLLWYEQEYAEFREQILDVADHDNMYRIMAGSESTAIRLGGVDEQEARQSHQGSGDAVVLIWI